MTTLPITAFVIFVFGMNVAAVCFSCQSAGLCVTIVFFAFIGSSSPTCKSKIWQEQEIKKNK